MSSASMTFSRKFDKILFVHGSRGCHGFHVKKRKSLYPVREFRVRKPPILVLEKTMAQQEITYAKDRIFCVQFCDDKLSIPWA